MGRKVSNEDFLKRLEITNSDVVPLEPYIAMMVKIKVSYKSCGHTEYKAPVKLLAGHECAHNSCRWKKLSDSKIAEAAERNIKRCEEIGITLLEPYKGTKIVKTRVRNEKCGHEYEANLGNIINGSGCPICHGMKDTDSFAGLLDEKYPSRYTVIGEYVNNRTPITVKHNECGNIWDVIPKSVTVSETCPNCILSKGERYVKDYLEKNGVTFEPQYRFSDCRNILPLPFDFAIKVDGELKLIEFDGTQHFSNSSNNWGAKLGKDTFESISKRDEIKNKYCKDNAIPLLRIPYWWIRNERAERELSKFIFNL